MSISFKRGQNPIINKCERSEETIHAHKETRGMSNENCNVMGVERL